MALDRESIHRTDFPVARKGYDPAAVHAHLRAIADEVATLQATPKQGDTLASSASDHVRAIIDAAETSAAKIRRDAEDSASAMRERARQHSRDLSASTAAMLERLETTKRELESVIESLRAQAGGLADAEAAAETERASEAVAPAPEPVAPMPEPVAPMPEPVAPMPEPVAPEPPGPAPEPAHAGEQAAAMPEPAHAGEQAAAVPEPAHAGEQAAAVPEPADVEEQAAAAPEPVGVQSSADAEGARLIALHMALNGTPRDETAKYLSEHYRLSDRDQLLDEVYASVQG